MTRTAAVAVLNAVVVAPLTRTVRNIPTELLLGPGDGLPTECAATFDGLRVVPKVNLVERISVLDDMKMVAACAALRNAVAC
jgi:mRNA interferase MazF